MTISLFYQKWFTLKDTHPEKVKKKKKKKKETDCCLNNIKTFAQTNILFLLQKL